jgi:hypothetical protein
MRRDDFRPEREVEELARLMPAPVERDIPGGRFQILREHLMNEMNHPAKRRMPTRLIPLAAALGAAALAVGVGVVALSPTHRSVAKTAPAANAVQLLDRIADVAYSQSSPAVRDNMYTYVKSEIARPESKGATKLAPLHLRQTWVPVANVCKGGFLIEGDYRGPNNIDYLPSECPQAGTLSNPTYRLLESLPTDPRSLLKMIYASPKTVDLENDRDQQVFAIIGRLVEETVAPPKIAAALYRAAAMIPGVSVQPDAVDAVGRHGVAISHLFTISPGYNERMEWIFNKTTLQMIGVREVALRGGLPGAVNPRDMVVNTIAILARGFADKPGQAPSRTFR